MDLRDLDVFMAIVERGGFRAAAEVLHLSQGAISRRLQQLEVEVGARLIARTVPAAPTPAGEALYARVAPAARELRAALADSKALTGRRVPVGYISPAIISLVPALLQTLRSRHPAPDVELHELPGPQIRAGLHEGRLALGFLLEDQVDDSLQFVPLRTFHYALAVPAGDALAQGPSVQAGKLGDRTLLTLARHEPVHARILEQLRQSAPQLRYQDAFGFSQIQHLVASGMGIAAVPAGFMAEPPPGIVVVDVEPRLPQSTIGMAAARPVYGALLRECFVAMRERFATAEALPVT